MEDRRRRVPSFALAIIALAGFAFAALARNSRALAQSNVPAGTTLIPSAIGPLSSGRPASTVGLAPPVTTLSPLALPVAAPSTAAPGAPAALSTTGALPALNPAPVVVAGGPTPIPQSVFTCSCWGVAFGTRWVGRVQSTNFQSASNAAAAQCTAYATNSGTQSPYILPPGGVSLGRNPFPNVNPNSAVGSVATGFHGTSPFTETSAAQTGPPPRAAGCAQCACD